jgi:hypothetical protein
MSSAALVQGIVISAVVAWAVAFTCRRLFPVTSRRLLARVVQVLDRPGLPDWLRSCARRIEPRATTGSSCSDGCSTCGGCGTAEASPEIPVLPLGFRARTKPPSK